MPLYLELLSMDKMFHSSKTTPIILNDLPSKTEADREYFNNLVKETFTTDVVSVLPSCQCGTTKGEIFVGTVADCCGTMVRQSIEDDITPSLWFRRPQPIGGVLVEKLMNPIIWMMLDDRFTASKYRVMQWLTDRNYSPVMKRPAVIDQMIADGIPRGYNSFVQNFNSIMDYLFRLPEFKMKKNKVAFLTDMLMITHPSQDPLQQLLAEKADCIFSDYIPILNRSMLVIEQNATGTYVDTSIVDIKDALNTMLSIDKDHFNQNALAIENRTAKIMVMLTEYYRSLFNKNLKPKEGLIRQHAHGSRSNNAFRGVITSHTEVHEHDEIHIPWCIAVTVFQLHHMNKLMRRDHPLGGYTNNEALELIYGHVHKYHAGLHQLINDLIKNATGGRGIPCLMQRNPTLMQGSAQLVRITKVKIEPNDATINISDLTANSMNADYDGDEINFTLAVDDHMAKLYYPFSPFFNLLMLTKPYEISQNAAMTDPIVASASDWIERAQAEAGL